MPEPMKRGVNPLPEPWQYIAVDLIDPFSTGESTLVVVDYYSRFYEVVVILKVNRIQCSVKLVVNCR